MKKWYFPIILVILLLSLVIKPKIGCLDNSHYMQEKFDSKEYHYVRCNCKCDQHAAKGLKCPGRNQCLECGHFHYPEPQFIVISDADYKSSPAKTSFPVDPQKALQERILNYLASQNQ